MHALAYIPPSPTSRAIIKKASTSMPGAGVGTDVLRLARRWHRVGTGLASSPYKLLYARVGSLLSLT